MALEIFIDESGYTGEHQLDLAQPIFVLSSINLGNEVVAELCAKHFTGVQADELKHSRLAKRPRGRQRILDLVQSLASMNGAGGVPVATAFAAHKQFQLLTLLVDLWVEPAMRRGGIDMYERGANVGFSNMSFCVLNLAPQFLQELLRRFEAMMRRRTPETYNKFWGFIYRALDKPSEISPDPQVQNMVREIITYFVGSERALGLPHLLGLPEHALDVAFSTVIVTANHWHERAGQPLRFTLDQSKYFAEAKWIWDTLTRPDLPQATFPCNGSGRIHFPLNVEGTRTANSKLFHQLQLADIVAGATAAFCASRADPPLRSDYTDALADAGILSLCISAIWPSSDVTPEEMGTSGMSGEHLNYIEAQLRKASS
jgi:hypothetical protein